MAWSMGRPRALVAAGVLAFSVLAVMPTTGSAPEVPAWLRAQQEMLALWRATTPSPELKALTSVQQTVVLRERPARRIDNAVRERARAAVRRALETEGEGESSWPEG